MGEVHIGPLIKTPYLDIYKGLELVLIQALCWRDGQPKMRVECSVTPELLADAMVDIDAYLRRHFAEVYDRDIAGHKEVT